MYTSVKCGFVPPVQAPDFYGGPDRILQNYYPTDETTGPGSKEQYIAPKLRIASSYGAVLPQISRTAARRRCATYQEAGRPAGRWRVPTKAEMQYICNLSAKGKIPKLFSPYPGWIKNSSGQINVYTATVHTASAVINDYRQFKQRDYSYYWSAQGPARVNGAYGHEITDQAVFGFDIHEGYPGGVTDDDVLNYGKVEVLDISNNRYGVENPHPDNSNQSGNKYNEGLRAEQTAVRCVYDEWYWVKVDGSPDILKKEDWTKFHWGDKEKASPQE